MRAIVIERFGGPDSLVYREMPEPEPMAGHVVIEVKAFGINHVSTLQEAPMPHSDTGERVTPVLDFPSRDGLAVHAVRVDYQPGGFSRVHRHPAGAYVYVIDGSVMFGLGGREPVLLNAGDAFYEPPGALHSVSRNASEEVPASFIAFFVLGDGEYPTVDDA